MTSNPLKGIVARACTDADFRRRLLADPRRMLADAGIGVPADVEVRIHETTEDKILLVLPTSESVALGDATHRLPSGLVADVPDGLTLEWQTSTVVPKGLLIAKGRIDESTAPALRRELQRAFVDIELDLAGVGFLSSAGLGALLAAQQHLKGQDCTLTLRGVPEMIRNVFELAGLAEVFEIHDLHEQTALFPKGAPLLFGGVGPTSPPGEVKGDD